jgi:hypothetical protein
MTLVSLKYVRQPFWSEGLVYEPHPQCATVNATFSEAKKGNDGTSKACNKTIEAVAPEVLASFSKVRLLSTLEELA